MNEITFNILKIVVSISAALISAYVIPLLKQKIAESKDRRLLEMVEIAVRAAEQTIKGSGTGALKKEEVIGDVTKWMVSHGILITEEQLDNLIEAAVFELNKKNKKED